MSIPASDSNSTPPTTSTVAARLRNLVVVLVAIALSVAVFLGLRTQNPESSLSAMAATATPLEVALDNHQPTLMEFYADWCTSCQAMAGDMAALKTEYGDRVNFVMLNVDNSKWLPELLHYRVDGIPHFVFLNAQGESLASAIGEQPKIIMAANLDALLEDKTLPYAQARGRASDVENPTLPTAQNDDPRSHGSQVVAN